MFYDLLFNDYYVLIYDFDNSGPRPIFLWAFILVQSGVQYLAPTKVKSAEAGVHVPVLAKDSSLGSFAIFDMRRVFRTPGTSHS